MKFQISQGIILFFIIRRGKFSMTLGQYFTKYFYWHFTFVLRVFCTSSMVRIFVKLRTKIISGIYYTVLPVGSKNSHLLSSSNMVAASLCLLFCESLPSNFQQIPHKNTRCLYPSYVGLYNYIRKPWTGRTFAVSLWGLFKNGNIWVYVSVGTCSSWGRNKRKTVTTLSKITRYKSGKI